VRSRLDPDSVGPHPAREIKDEFRNAAAIGDDGAAEASRGNPDWAVTVFSASLVWAGGDGAALAPMNKVPSSEVGTDLGDEHHLSYTPDLVCSLQEESPALEACPTPPPRGWDRQALRRRHEHDLRKRAIAFRGHARDSGWSTSETAAALGVSARTLSHWNHEWETGRLAPHARGRPPRIAPAERQDEVAHFLEVNGPTISMATLRAEYTEVARAELADLRSDYLAGWRSEHTVEQCRLEWLCPGTVWAMDFTHPPHLIDGVFPAILNVRDLASHHQLFWLPVEDETAATVVRALSDLFAQHGPPLVLKCDNGPAFIARMTKGFLRECDVFTLCSPPYCAPYNGACERANRTMKELTEHVSDQAGRPGFWRSDDLLAARLRANRLSRPWGPAGSTPEESWSSRRQLTLDERDIMWQYLNSGTATVREQRLLDATVALPHYTQTEIERIAAQPVLETLGLLRVTRRRIAPAI
jgi:transposase-like protein